MIKRIKKFFSQWHANRQHTKELNRKLEALVDPTFLERATNGL